MENAVIGVFDDFRHAQDAADALVQAGFREWAVQITPKQETHTARETALDDRARYASSQDWSIGNFFRSLFGLDADHEHAHVYSEALRRGSFLVTVEAEGEAPIEQAREIMGQFHPVDIHERAAHWRSQGWSRFDAGSQAYTDEQVQRERSAYQTMTGGGQRGNANVQSFTRPATDTSASPGGGSEIGGVSGTSGFAGAAGPAAVAGVAGGTNEAPAPHRYQAAADVGGGAGYGATSGSVLHPSEPAQPTGSAGTLGTLGAGNTDLHESSGVAGDATDRIREEVLGGEELQRDTMGGAAPGSVREPMGAGSYSGDPSSAGAGAGTSATVGTTAGATAGAGTAAPLASQRFEQRHAERDPLQDQTSGIMGNAAMRDSTAPDIYTVDHDADYRTHWQKAYHMQGRYEDFEPAYRFGADLHRNDAMKGYHNWNEIEPEAQRHWESGSGETSWEHARHAVRHAWERMKG